jgi:SAM-dependent methyltransferase
MKAELTFPQKRQLLLSKNKYLRDVYVQFSSLIEKELKKANDNFPILEIGAGAGFFQSIIKKKKYLLSDITPAPYLSLSLKGEKIPFKSETLSSIVGIDVFHHLSNPWSFLKEAFRTLLPSGKVILIEPYPSLFSLPVYRLFHPEPFDLEFDYFSSEKADFPVPNQALAYILFFKRRKEFLQSNSEKWKIKTQLLPSLSYLFSLGYRKHPLPYFPFLSWIWEKIDWLCQPISPFVSFRCLIVLEKLS